MAPQRRPSRDLLNADHKAANASAARDRQVEGVLLVKVLSITFGRFLAARDSQIIFSVTHGWSAFGGPTMRSILPDWEVELARWLKPFLEQLGHKARRQIGR